MKVYEKARIKLLDKKTGEILKEVDPLTSAEAVDYDGTNTVKDKIITLDKYATTNDATITALKRADTDQVTSINGLNTKYTAQQSTLTNITAQNATIASDIASIKTQISATLKFRQF